MTPVARRPRALEHVRVGMAHTVHRRHPRDPEQTLCGVMHPFTHADLRPTQEPVSCPRCLGAGPGRAA